MHVFCTFLLPLLRFINLRPGYCLKFFIVQSCVMECLGTDPEKICYKASLGESVTIFQQDRTLYYPAEVAPGARRA